MIAPEDQVVEIRVPGDEREHRAIGGPSLIAAALQAGEEVVCERDVVLTPSRTTRRVEYVLRILPGTGGVVLTYPESDADERGD